MAHSFILTSNGTYFDFGAVEDFRFDIESIAHALSHLCRFTGHTETFYSVAEHSVRVSHIVPEELALAGLMHDAAEAFLGDVSTHLKALLQPQYGILEELIEAHIAKRFGLPFSMPSEIKAADLTMLATERRDLMPDVPDEGRWDIIKDVKPLYDFIIPWPSDIAKGVFLNRFKELST